MLKHLTHIALSTCLLLLVTVAAVPFPQEKQERQAKDQQEYDLITGAQSETDPAKKIAILDQWNEKYPETDYKDTRLEMYMYAYQQAKQPAKAHETAKKLLEMNPQHFGANYTITLLTPFLGGASPDMLNDGEATAKTLLGGAIESQFTAENKPDNRSQAEWDSAEKQATVAAHRTLGWIAMQRSNSVEAEKQFKQVLEMDPNAGQVSYWLGDVVLKQGDPSKNETALFSFARAAVYDGEGALPPESRKQVDDYLTKVYTKYTGTEEGLAEIREMAKTQALPPADLEIESAAVRSFKAEQQARKSNPLFYRYIDLKANLTGANGQGTWSELQGKLTPEMSLFVVGADPPTRPQTIHLSSKKGGSIEVVLNLENRRRTGLGAGQQVRFEGVAASLSRDPFRLTLNDGRIIE